MFNVGTSSKSAANVGNIGLSYWHRCYKLQVVKREKFIANVCKIGLSYWHY